MPDYRYWLCDLSEYDDEYLKARIGQTVFLQVGLLLLKYIKMEADLSQVRDILVLANELQAAQTGWDYLLVVVRYLSEGAKYISEADLHHLITDTIEKGDVLMATVAETWLERGRTEGEEKGREATLKVLRHYLSTRFSLDLDHFDAVLSTFDLPTLTHLSDAAFEAESLADFEAALQTLTAADSRDESATNE